FVRGSVLALLTSLLACSSGPGESGWGQSPWSGDSTSLGSGDDDDGTAGTGNVSSFGSGATGNTGNFGSGATGNTGNFGSGATGNFGGSSGSSGSSGSGSVYCAGVLCDTGEVCLTYGDGSQMCGRTCMPTCASGETCVHYNDGVIACG